MHKTLTYIVLFCTILLSSAMIANACPPDCGDCESYNGYQCVWQCSGADVCCDGSCDECCDDSDCPGCQSCYGGSCYDDDWWCDECEYCEDASCEAIEVYSVTSNKTSATLCENIMFAAATDPPESQDDVQWSGGQCPSGTSEGSTFTTSYSCIGTKTVTAALCDSDEPKNVSIVLPNGCEEGTTGGADLTVYVTDVAQGTYCLNCNCCGITPDYGYGGDGVIEAVYNDCEWIFLVGAQREVFSGVCTGNFVEVAAYYPYLTEGEYCSIVGVFVSGGCGSGGHPVLVFANAEAEQAHENEHVEMLQEKLLEQDSLLATKESMSNMEIDCDLWWTHDCTDAVACRQEDIWSDVAVAWLDAWQAMSAEGEDRPNAAERPYNEAVARSLCEYARTEGWEYCEACGQVGVEPW